MHVSTPKLGLVLLSAFAACTNARQNNLRVNLGHDQLIVEGKSVDNTDSFLNIRFGQDTSGANRFTHPKPFSYPPGTVINATQAGAACPQQKVPTPNFPIFDNVTNISEDCLTLRVDRPANTTSTDKLPVMVWIYGGGDTIGQIYDQIYDPSQLLASANGKGTPVIFVAMNYRLGIFGFAASPALNATNSLNAGLLDQRLALEWVHQNIAAFGGDPENVTIFGESDGATAVGLHITAYGAKNTTLFKRAIMESGSALADPGIALGESAKHTAKLTTLVNCTASTSAKELACLRSLPLDTLLSTAITYEFSLDANGGLDVFIPVAPTPFIPDSPHRLLSSGRFARNIDIISGWNENDGSFFVADDPTTIKTDKDVAKSLLVQASRLSSKTISKALALYPLSDFPSDPAQNISAQWYRASRMIRDSQYTCGNLYTTQMNRKYSPEATSYLYTLNQTMFAYALAEAESSFYGVCHFSDIPFVFDLASTRYEEVATRLDVRLASQMSAAWASFAVYGSPSGTRGSLVNWDEALPSKKFNGTYDINVLGGSHPGMIRSDSYEDLNRRCAFWNSKAVLTEMLG